MSFTLHIRFRPVSRARHDSEERMKACLNRCLCTGCDGIHPFRQRRSNYISNVDTREPGSTELSELPEHLKEIDNIGFRSETNGGEKSWTLEGKIGTGSGVVLLIVLKIRWKESIAKSVVCPTRVSRAVFGGCEGIFSDSVCKIGRVLECSMRN